jgi:hypothetical protein
MLLCFPTAYGCAVASFKGRHTTKIDVRQHLPLESTSLRKRIYRKSTTVEFVDDSNKLINARFGPDRSLRSCQRLILLRNQGTFFHDHNWLKPNLTMNVFLSEALTCPLRCSKEVNPEAMFEQWVILDIADEVVIVTALSVFDSDLCARQHDVSNQL